MNGKGFPEMLKRQAAAEEAAQARMAKLKAEQLQKEQEERDRRKLEVEAKRKKLAQDAKNQLSWSELQKIQEETRRERIERHKQKLAQESALPNSLAESLKRVHREPPVENKVPAGANEFRAEDPAKVFSSVKNTLVSFFSRFFVFAGFWPTFVSENCHQLTCLLSFARTS